MKAVIYKQKWTTEGGWIDNICYPANFIPKTVESFHFRKYTEFAEWVEKTSFVNNIIAIFRNKGGLPLKARFDGADVWVEGWGNI